MGFPRSPNNHSRTTLESDIIIGVLDSGICTESDSFSDEGFASPPERWKGNCPFNFTCNNKIIGARYYRGNGDFKEGEIKYPIDSEGHGTLVASIAAGLKVVKTSFYGLSKDTARGDVPSAWIAVYKVGGGMDVLMQRYSLHLMMQLQMVWTLSLSQLGEIHRIILTISTIPLPLGQTYHIPCMRPLTMTKNYGKIVAGPQLYMVVIH